MNARLEKSRDQLLSNPNPSVIHHRPGSFHDVVALLPKGRPENRESIPIRAWDSFLLRPHRSRASYEMGIASSFPVIKAARAWISSHTSASCRGRMPGSVSPLPLTSSWCEWIKHRNSFIVCLYNRNSVVKKSRNQSILRASIPPSDAHIRLSVASVSYTNTTLTIRDVNIKIRVFRYVTPCTSRVSLFRRSILYWRRKQYVPPNRRYQQSIQYWTASHVRWK
jgi:hypothetical protein